MGYANIQADSNFYRQSLNADGVKYVTGPYTSLYEDVFRAVTVTTDSVVSVTSYVGDSLSNQFLLAGTEIYGLFSSVTIHSGKAVLHLAGASYISEIINQYSATGIPLGFYEEGTQCLSQKISALLTQGLFDDASWVMVPSQYKEDTVRAFKPTSELGNLAFTRSSDATYTDSTGVVRRSPYNLFQQSEAFNVSPWSLSRTSAFGSGSIVNATTAPNGTLTADYIQQASGQTNSGGVFIAMPYFAGQSYTLSVYAKKAETRYIRPGFAIGVGGSGIFGYFDLETGVVGTPDVGVTQTMQSVGDGWYRCSISATSQVTTLGNTFIYQSSTNSPTTTPLEGVFIWGAQLVQGSEALPYFATTDRLNVPRLDYRNADGTLSTCPRLLLEPQRTNSIRNSSMVGAVAGSPGTLPTNWTQFGGDGLTRTIVGIGTENGLSYIDLRFNGTATSTSVLIGIELPNAIAATVGQSWTESAYCKIISATSNANSYALLVYERSSVGTYLTEGSTVIVPTPNLQRFAFTRTTTSATIAYVQPYIRFNLTNGTAYDFTIRIAAPQMELGTYATTWVPTTTTAVTRIADAASKTGVASLIGQTEGTMFLDFESGVNDSIDYVFGINNGTTNSRIIIYRSSTNNIIMQVRVAGGSQALIQTATVIANTRYKCAVAYKVNDVAFYVNGAQIGIDTLATIPACSIIATNDGAGAGLFGRPVNQAALFPVRLDNATLAALTTL